jgi:hypothetical protein
MSFMQCWRYALRLPLAATGRVSVTVRLSKDEAQAFAQFMDYWDWKPNPRSQGEWAAMRRAGARIKRRLRLLGFEPRSDAHSVWVAMQHLPPNPPPQAPKTQPLR